MTNVVLRLSLASLVPVLMAAGFYLAGQRTRLGRLRGSIQQLIIGVSFGIAAIVATEFGIPYNGAVINVRNAGPMTAGLIFGWPAGIISGVIGGVERLLTPTGDFTRLACTLGTILSGLLGAGVRRFMMDNKKATWFYGLAVGVTSEVMHMLLVFLTHPEDIQRAFDVVKACAIPMITANGISVMVSTVVISLLRRGKADYYYRMEDISQTFQRGLLACIILAFIVTSSMTQSFQTRLAYDNADRILRTNIDDVERDVRDAANRKLLDITLHLRTVAHEGMTSDQLKKLALDSSVAEINLVNGEGIITASSNPDHVGFDMASGAQSAEFLVLLEDTGTLVQDFQPMADNERINRKYAGAALEEGFLQVGYDAITFYQAIKDEVLHATQNRHIGQNGSIIICDGMGTVLSDRNGHEGENIAGGAPLRETLPEEDKRFSATIYGKDSFCMYSVAEGFYILGVISKTEALFSRDAAVYMLAFMEVIVFAALFASVFFLIRRIVVRNVQRINDSLAQITGGNLDETVQVRDNAEFAALSDGINTTVTALRHYIDEAAEKMEQELRFAKQIQHSALPSVFPPYPNRKDFSIFACMDTAREVGGDFYDFYLLGEDRLAFLIADVSGKGIPAAMFMMTAKTVIKSYAESGLEVNEVFTRANEKLCESNTAGMFVTAWMGILDLKTGMVTIANAGHNPPLIRRADGRFEYLKMKVNFVLAGMEGVRYRKSELKLNPGDELFLYTDGVTEAQDAAGQLYGEERLLDCLNESGELTVEQTCARVKGSIDRFVGKAEQFDDITMLSLRLTGARRYAQLTVEPNEASIAHVAAFIELEMEKRDVPLKLMNRMQIVLDEIYSNIVRYSRAKTAVVRLGVAEDRLTLIFEDDGVPYNPLEEEEPDVTLSAQQRKIGGLGIFMVRKMMDSVEYEHREGKNILTLMLNIGP